MNPGLQPISKPPGKVSFGIDWKTDSKYMLAQAGKTAKQVFQRCRERLKNKIHKNKCHRERNSKGSFLFFSLRVRIRTISIFLTLCMTTDLRLQALIFIYT
jgi:hypothetical protein